MAKKYGRHWRKLQRSWRKRDSHIIEKAHFYIQQRKMLHDWNIGRSTQTSRNKRKGTATSHSPRSRERTILSRSQDRPFTINRHHPLWSSLPITWFNGKRPPNWENLSQWCKVQLALIPLAELGCITFTGNLSPALEAKLVARGEKGIVEELRNRLRRNLRAVTGVEKLEFLFMLEGHSKDDGKETYLHIHGVAASDRLTPIPDDNRDMIKEAVAKTVGQWERRRINDRAVHAKAYWKAGRAYGNYIFKYFSRKDDRMGGYRLAASQPLIAGTREFWLAISGLDGTRKVPRNARRVPPGSEYGRIVAARKATRKRISLRQSEIMRWRHAMKRMAKATNGASAVP